MAVTPRPGDFAVIASRSAVGVAVDVMEFLSGGLRPTEFSHACICSQVKPDGTVMIVEAMPGGAVEVPWHYEDADHLWSTGLVTTGPGAGVAARQYIGWGYGWADYGVLALHTWHVPGAPELMARYQHTRTIICSQLVDQAEMDDGCHLFNDGRAAGYVRPSDLAGLLLDTAYSKMHADGRWPGERPLDWSRILMQSKGRL